MDETTNPNRNQQSRRWLVLLGLLLAVLPILAIGILDRPLAHPQTLTIAAAEDDRLKGTYYRGAQPFGVLLLEGFGSDQVTMTSLASAFAGNGWHVFTFDFSGHGRSPGALTFDNAQTDRLARQALAALQVFKRESGLRADQIFVIGHSLGARVALQSATLNPEKTAGIILLGAQVNLSTNVQSEFFTGTSDTDLAWVQALSPANPDLPVLLVSGAWDDILTPQNAERLFRQLTKSPSGSAEGTEAEGRAARELTILPVLLHNYEPFSPRVMRTINRWIEKQAVVTLTDSPAAVIRIGGWIVSLAGMFLILIGGAKVGRAAETSTREISTGGVVNLRRFLWGKLLLWLAALPVSLVLGSLFFFLPLAKPVLNLIYGSFIGGYGILLLTLYARGKMPGVSGRLWDNNGQDSGRRTGWRDILAVLAITAGMMVLTAAYARTGWFYVFPLNLRLAWLFIFTPFTALGFWIGLREGQLLPAKGWGRTASALIGLLPFFLYTLLMAGLGSLSGMVGGLQGLVILWLVLSFGNAIQAVGKRSWLTAVCMAVLLYWLILPQSVLF